jgi:hypothetical protein
VQLNCALGSRGLSKPDVQPFCSSGIRELLISCDKRDALTTRKREIHRIVNCEAVFYREFDLICYRHGGRLDDDWEIG